MSFQTKPHIDLARLYWQKWVSPGDKVIDATVGNGHDTLFLAKLLKGKGKLIGYDIQPQAIAQTKKRLESLSENERSIVSLHLMSHSQFSESGVKLIVYNLGYLPGGDKSITTLAETSLDSLKAALPILAPSGKISMTCYPGHPEGKREEAALFDYLKTLSSHEWDVGYHQWLNRSLFPSLFLIQRRTSSIMKKVPQISIS
ncbi:MAG: class I SAM-dependent methyltransferase [Chlamydiales bacterium]